MQFLHCRKLLHKALPSPPHNLKTLRDYFIFAAWFISLIRFPAALIIFLWRSGLSPGSAYIHVMGDSQLKKVNNISRCTKKGARTRASHQPNSSIDAHLESNC
jgi:hypothetical protein